MSVFRRLLTHQPLTLYRSRAVLGHSTSYVPLLASTRGRGHLVQQLRHIEHYHRGTNAAMREDAMKFAKPQAAIGHLSIRSMASNKMSPKPVSYLVGAAILRQSPKYKSKWQLLVLRRSAVDDTFPNLWTVPAGHVEEGETFGQAVEREVLEETGLIVEDIVTELQQLRWRDEGENVMKNFVVIVKASGSVNSNPQEYSAWKWVDEDDVAKLPCSEGMAAVFSNAFRFARLG